MTPSKTRRVLIAVFLNFLLAPAVWADDAPSAPVTDEMLLKAQDNADAWLHYARNYES